jgi:hypothetical protein
MVLMALVLGITCAGCGPSLYKTRGKVLKDGKPLVPENGALQITFFPVLPAGQQMTDYYYAEVDQQNGTFQAYGARRQGVPPGKYRIALELNRKKKDMFEGKYDGERSPFIFDINGSTGELVIDLDKPPAGP